MSRACLNGDRFQARDWRESEEGIGRLRLNRQGPAVGCGGTKIRVRSSGGVSDVGGNGGSPFVEPLATEYAGQSLQFLEVKIMMRHLEAIGFLGETSDAAIAFLKKSTAAGDWEPPGRRDWSSADRNEGWVTKLLASVAIQALGISGRPESLETIMELAKGPSHSVGPNPGALLDAVFHQTFLAQNGRDAWNRVYFDGSMFEEYMKWNTGTEEGRRWAEWFQEILAAAPDDAQ